MAVMTKKEETHMPGETSDPARVWSFDLKRDVVPCVVALAVLAFFIWWPFYYYSYHHSVRIPPETDLLTEQGVLQYDGLAYGGGRAGSRLYYYVRLVGANDTSDLPFVCDPSQSDVQCIFNTPYGPALGKQASIKYFLDEKDTFPLYSIHKYHLLGNESDFKWNKPSAQIMELTVYDDAGAHDLISYDDSVKRLQPWTKR